MRALATSGLAQPEHRLCSSLHAPRMVALTVPSHFLQVRKGEGVACVVVSATTASDTAGGTGATRASDGRSSEAGGASSTMPLASRRIAIASSTGVRVERVSAVFVFDIFFCPFPANRGCSFSILN